MTRFKEGDTVIIANTEKVMFSKDYFKNGDLTTVIAIEDDSFGHAINVEVPRDKVDNATDWIGDTPVLYISNEELEYLVKILPDNKGESK